MFEHMYGKAPKPHDEALMWGLAALVESMGSIDYRESVGPKDGVEDMDSFFDGAQHGLLLAMQLIEAMRGQDNLTYVDFLMVCAGLAGMKTPNDVRDLLRDDAG